VPKPTTEEKARGLDTGVEWKMWDRPSVVVIEWVILGLDWRVWDTTLFILVIIDPGWNWSRPLPIKPVNIHSIYSIKPSKHSGYKRAVCLNMKVPPFYPECIYGLHVIL
jgi:hypothetical protein